jgi:hypothetical protein
VAAPHSRTNVGPERRSKTGAASPAHRASRPETKARVELARDVKALKTPARNGSRVAMLKNGSKVGTLKKGSKVATLRSDNKGATLNSSKGATLSKTANEVGEIEIKPLVKASVTKIATPNRTAAPSSNVLTRPVGRRIPTGRQGKVLETATISGTSNKGNATNSNETTSSSKDGSVTTSSSSRVNGRMRLAVE